MRVRLVTIVAGIRYLLLGAFWTPRHLRHLDHDEPPYNESELAEMLRHWAAQQAVAWCIARGLAWSALVAASLLWPG